MARWDRAGRALKTLADSLPGFEDDVLLLKVAAVNELYTTNLFDVQGMAEHIASLISRQPPRTPDLVDEIAALPEPGRQRRFLSFASKFVHFFMDESFPSYDAYALSSLWRHLGNHPAGRAPSYAEFFEDVYRLRELASVACSVGELGQYLWLSGAYGRWKRNPAQISREAAGVFSSSSPEVRTDLDGLVGNAQA